MPKIFIVGPNILIILFYKLLTFRETYLSTTYHNAQQNIHMFKFKRSVVELGIITTPFKTNTKHEGIKFQIPLLETFLQTI